MFKKVQININILRKKQYNAIYVKIRCSLSIYEGKWRNIVYKPIYCKSIEFVEIRTNKIY